MWKNLSHICKWHFIAFQPLTLVCSFLYYRWNLCISFMLCKVKDEKLNPSILSKNFTSCKLPDLFSWKFYFPGCYFNVLIATKKVAHYINVSKVLFKILLFLNFLNCVHVCVLEMMMIMGFLSCFSDQLQFHEALRTYSARCQPGKLSWVCGLTFLSLSLALQDLFF